ncbi:actin cortical patch SUR7/pH-response regulator pali [Phycomyces nitens]|nr:actin cortical patch SUR7/pH-response regulator pali [Phycomyces nitens]
MAIFAYLATFLTFAALVLQIFTLIGNTSNRSFLTDLYYARIGYGNTFYTLGLWSYCTGTDTVLECTDPAASYKISEIKDLGSLLDGTYDQLIKANFILYWIGFGLTFFALVITLCSHFRRFPDILASICTFLACVVMLASFAIMLVPVIAVKRLESSQEGTVTLDEHFGPTTWMTLGAAVALLLSSLWYLISCCTGSGRRVHDTEKL